MVCHELKKNRKERIVTMEHWEILRTIGAILAYIGIAGIIFPGLSIYKAVKDVTHDETMESDTKEINILKKIIYVSVVVFFLGSMLIV